MRHRSTVAGARRSGDRGGTALPILIRTIAFGGFLGLVGIGLVTSEGITDARWLSLLGVAWLLLVVACWPRLPRGLPAFNRSVLRTALILTTVFAVLSLQLVRIQLVQGDAVAERVGEAPNG